MTASLPALDRSLRPLALPALGLLLIGLPARAEPPTATAGAAPLAQFRADLGHGELAFSVRHFGLTSVRGRFEQFDVVLAFDPAAPERSRVEVVIDADSLTTGNEERDESLRSPDFLDVATHPEIRFHSLAIRREEGGFRVRGALTLHGVERELELLLQLRGPIADLGGRERIGVEGTATLDRRDFGLVWDRLLPDGGLVVAHEVRIELSLELVRTGAPGDSLASPPDGSSPAPASGPSSPSPLHPPSRWLDHKEAP